MTIYIEQILIDNLIINYIILYCTFLILKEKGKFLRLFSSALIGSVYALFSPLLNFPNIVLTILKIILGLFMISLTKKFKNLKEFFLYFVVFIFLTFLFGGVCLFILISFDKNFNVQNYSTYSLPLGIIVLILFLMSVVLKNIFKNVYKRKNINNFIYNMIIFNNNSYTKLLAFLDSGNLLIDTLTKKPITIVDYNSVKDFFKISLTDILLNRIDNLNKTLKNAHLFEVKSVGGNKKIIVFEVDKIEIGTKDFKKEINNAVIGITLKSFINDLGYNALIGYQFVGEKT